MIYTVQLVSQSGSFSAPQGTDVEIVRSKKSIKACLEAWAEEHDLVGSDPQDAAAFVWWGVERDVTDLYPDYQATLGPRGGFRMTPC